MRSGALIFEACGSSFPPRIPSALGRLARQIAIATASLITSILLPLAAFRCITTNETLLRADPSSTSVHFLSTISLSLSHPRHGATHSRDFCKRRRSLGRPLCPLRSPGLDTAGWGWGSSARFSFLRLGIISSGRRINIPMPRLDYR